MRAKTFIGVALAVLAVGVIIYLVYRPRVDSTSLPFVSQTSWEGTFTGADGITWNGQGVITFHADGTAWWRKGAVQPDGTPGSWAWRDGCYWQSANIISLDCPAASPLGHDIAELKVENKEMSGSFTTSCQPGYFGCPPSGVRSWTVRLHQIAYLGYPSASQ